MLIRKIKKNNSGFTLIEALTLLFIFALITVTFYSVMTAGLRYITYSKNRLGAVAVANEKMEIARNLNYDDVGTQGGDCSGDIPQGEDVTENGITYHVSTYATYVDDPFDGTLGGSPNDIAWHDYKKLVITVYWDYEQPNQDSVKVSSNFVSPSMETVNPDDGILSINVLSDQDGGAAVQGASVHVVNPDVGINEVVTTDSAGNVMLLGAKEGVQDYQITVSKDGYETVSTMPPYPDTPDYNPTDVNATVIAGTLNIANIIENRLAKLKVSTVDYLGDPVSGVDIKVNGGREMGTDPNSPYTPTYNLDFSGQTDASGEKDFGEVSPGQYTFDMTSSGYALIGSDIVSPYAVASGDDKNIILKVADKNSTTGLLVTVQDSSDSSPISGASVELVNSTLGYDETVTTDAKGLAFFPDSSDEFQPGDYDMTVTDGEHQDQTKTETINSGALTEDTVEMSY